MKPLYYLFFTLITVNSIYAQDTARAIEAKNFFTLEAPITATLSTDLGALINNKNKDKDVKAFFAIKLADSTEINEEIGIRPRGNFRLKNCFIPPLKLNFKTPTSPKLSPLKSLKLVNGCNTGSYNDQLVLKEFLVYKIHNLLSDKSFRVRLVNLKIEDSKGKKKPLNVHSFFIEDIDEMAKRNKCKKLPETVKINTEQTDRENMTFVAIFQYMIGNTDWAVPVCHNIRLISSKKDSLLRPYAIPYDFDYSGLVNASYAVPDERLGTETVRERVYRGFPRNMSELNTAIEIFTAQKAKIYALIENFEPLSTRSKNEMKGYLDEFYGSIKSESSLKELFINNARRE